jgi:hypothetical protein
MLVCPADGKVSYVGPATPITSLSKIGKKKKCISTDCEDGAAAAAAEQEEEEEEEEVYLEQVKGVHYPLSSFTGPLYLWKPPEAEAACAEAAKALSERSAGDDSDDDPDRIVLHQCLVYLAPHNYHRVHSAADAALVHRSHFRGACLPVLPLFVSLWPGLFSLQVSNRAPPHTSASFRLSHLCTPVSSAGEGNVERHVGA